MKKAAVYSRSVTDSHEIQREELVAKFGETHEIVAEYLDDASGNLGIGDRPGLMKLLADAATGKFDVLLCTDITRLGRRLSPEVVTALRDAGVRVVTADRGVIGWQADYFKGA